MKLYLEKLKELYSNIGVVIYQRGKQQHRSITDVHVI